MNQTAEKVLTDIRKYSILKVTFFLKSSKPGSHIYSKKMGGDSRLIWNISKINYLMLPSLASEPKGAPMIVHELCIWTLTVWRGMV